MALINSIDLINKMGAAPERSSRTALNVQDFETHLQQALSSRENAALASTGGTALENSLMHSALQGFSSLFGNASSAIDSSAARPGELTAQYESGSAGISAIGYDRVGGTSYGTYQIASKPGSMDEFISFLRARKPDWAEALQASGPANTGSTKGRMPATWKSIAAESPAEFQEMQREFIEQTHYTPARDKILAATGIDMNAQSPAVQEALWSTAVQHGPGGAAAIFNQAVSSISASPSSRAFASALIDKVYAQRATKFGSSTAQVQASVQNRMVAERELIHSMLSGETTVA